ncbi:MAG: GntG family PLP-dependent aldolase [Candidatus Kapaibacterium sp.]
MIDLRSDTVTVPTDAMRDAMANAPVGDDVYGEDPTVNELQEYAADLLGKEAALYVPAGVMGNQICIALHTQTGDEVIVEGESHIFHYETSAPAIIAGVQLHCVPSPSGEMSEESLRRAIRPSDYYFPRTSLICLENTHNRHGGTLVGLDYIRQTAELARENNCAFHCDGARLWNASAATGIAPKDYAAEFDTLSVCLSKGLGAPVGSLIVGRNEHIHAARKWRKILGGGMRQVGILAAAGLHALKFHREALAGDHRHARDFAERLASSPYIRINLDSVQTNIVVFGFPSSINPLEFIAACKQQGLLVSQGRTGWMRAVFHFQVSEQDAQAAAEIVVRAVEERML